MFVRGGLQRVPGRGRGGDGSHPEVRGVRWSPGSDPGLARSAWRSSCPATRGRSRSTRSRAFGPRGCGLQAARGVGGGGRAPAHPDAEGRPSRPCATASARPSTILGRDGHDPEAAGAGPRHPTHPGRAGRAARPVPLGLRGGEPAEVNPSPVGGTQPGLPPVSAPTTTTVVQYRRRSRRGPRRVQGRRLHPARRQGPVPR